jgi:predicted cupin superfamily sugar epimerase
VTPSALGLEPHPEDGWAVLVACFVWPGFDVADLELELS